MEKFRNENNVLIKKSCVSCIYKDYTNNPRKRLCKLNGAIIDGRILADGSCVFDKCCSAYETAPNILSIGSGEKGKVKRGSYLSFLASAIDSGTIDELRLQYMQKFNLSIYLNSK